MIRWCKEGLFRKLGLLLLAGMTCLCVVQFAFGYWGGIRYFDETAQREYFSVAVYVANEIQPELKSSSFDEERVRKIFSEVERQNPMLRGYLVDRTGKIRSASIPISQLSRAEVSVRQLESALTFELPEFPMWIAEPRLREDGFPGGVRVFAVEPVRFGNEKAYIVLTMFPPVAEALRNGGVDGQGVGALFSLLAPAFLTTSLVTVLGLYLLTRYFSRRFRDFVAAANELGAGNYHAELPLGSTDTLGELAERFNRMKESIRRNDTELLERERKRRQLLATVAHDLRVPISIIKGVVELLRNPSGADASLVEQHVVSLRRNTERQRGFLSNLEELADLECEPGNRKLTSFTLGECTKGVEESLAAVAREGGVSLEVRDTLGDEPVVADRLWVERLLQNLISNAIRYTPEGGRVTIELAPERSGARIAVSDTGSGIPEECLPHLFDEFYRVPRPSESDPGGTGLGLAIVKRIVDFHGGTISVRSTIGAGTTFTAVLPFGPDRTLTGRANESSHPEVISDPEAAREVRGSRVSRLCEAFAPEGPLTPYERTMVQRTYLCLTLGAFFGLAGTADKRFLLGWTIVSALLAISQDSSLVTRRLVARIACFAVLVALFVISLSPMFGAWVLLLMVAGGILVRRLYGDGLNPKARMDLFWCFLLGVHSCMSLFQLPSRPQPSYALLGALLCSTVFVILIFVRRVILYFVMVFLPACIAILQFRAQYERDEPLLMGALAGIVLGAILVSVFYERVGRRIEMRVAVLIGVAVQAASFFETYQVIRAWKELSARAAETQLLDAIDTLGAEIATRILSGDEEGAFRAVDRFSTMYPSVDLLRATSNGQVLDRTSNAICVGNCFLGEWFKARYPATPVRINELVLRYDNNKDLASAYEVEIPLGAGPSQKLLFLAPVDGSLNRTMEERYALVAVLLAVVGVMIFAYYFRRVFTWQVAHRLNALLAAMGMLEAGNEKPSIEAKQGDEIDKLGLTLHSMADALSSRRAAVKHADTKRRELIFSIVEALRAPMSRLEEAVRQIEAVGVRGIASISSDSLAEIGAIAEQQISVVDDLFLLSKLEMTEQLTRAEVASVEELLEEISGGLARSGKGPQVLIEASDELPLVPMNIVYFSRALAECIMEAGTGQTAVRSVVRKEGSRLVVDISSEGSPASAVGRSTVADSAGVSLSLTLAERILALHHAEVRRNVAGNGSLRISIEQGA